MQTTSENMVLVFHVVVHQFNAVAVLETPTPPSSQRMTAFAVPGEENIDIMLPIK
jgi:hypothetical protein